MDGTTRRNHQRGDVTKMSIATIENIKQLRAQMDAPYQDCVKALEANGNDITQASQWLKETNKASVRDAKTDCGAIGCFIDGSGVTLVVAKCETDFVAINEKFTGMVDQLAENLHNQKPNAIEEFKESAWVFKEAVDVGECVTVNAVGSSQVAVYLHHNRELAAIVTYVGGTSDAAKKIAMQVCAMKPVYIRVENIDTEKYQQWIDKAKQEARETGKPEAILDKIAEGKVKSTLKESVLMEQSMFDDAKTTVAQFTANAKMEVLKFVRVTL